MFAIQVTHEISFSSEVLGSVNRILDLLELKLQIIPKLEKDLKESNDTLEIAVNSQTNKEN